MSTCSPLGQQLIETVLLALENASNEVKAVLPETPELINVTSTDVLDDAEMLSTLVKIEKQASLLRQNSMRNERNRMILFRQRMMVTMLDAIVKSHPRRDCLGSLEYVDPAIL
eukprot:gb/GECG01005925.1/.p1 GENE.gb/GECG01005925.1/~~gb/GECG01005925.1/.p1  ORF type:complete len:113 (+),score=15.27 gb/GECG01005925.1/:1-339(+)